MNIKKSVWRDRILFFSLGAFCLLVISLLMGAASDYKNSTLNFGRYQISSWATQLGTESGAIGGFVLDTVSGDTRTVYMRTYGDPGKGKLVKNGLKKPFHSIQ